MPTPRSTPIRPWAAVPAALLSLALVACGTAGGEAPNDSAAAAAPPVPVRTAAVIPADVAEPVRATGVLAGKEELSLSFKVGGIVSRLLVDEGAAVRGGQTLALLDPVEVDAAVSRARSAADQTGRDVARLRRLYRDSVATLAQLEAAETGAAVAQADLRAASFNRRYATVIAPAAGTVLRRLVEAGELVAPGAPVLVMRVAGRGLVLRVGLADRDAVRVRRGDRAIVHFDAYPGERFPGEVAQVAVAAAAGTGTYEVEIAVEAAERTLASGLVGTVEIASSTTARVALVPIEALIEADGDSGSVFAVVGQRASRRAVRIGFVRGGQAAVASGLDGVSLVATDGVGYLRDGAAVAVLPAERGDAALATTAGRTAP